MRRAWALCLCAVLRATTAAAQAPTWTLRAYLDRVSRANLDLLARRLDVPIAEAQISVARIVPDPVVTMGVGTWEPSGAVMPPATTLSLTVPFELGGRRGARVSAAEAARDAARAELDDVVRGLRADAALAFVEVLHTRAVVERRRATLGHLERLVNIAEQRHRAGDVGEIAVVQSRVEYERFRTEVIASEGEARAAALGLAVFTAGEGSEDAQGSLVFAPREFDVEALVRRATTSRPDVVAAQRGLSQARAEQGLARANRWVDGAVTLGWAHNFEGQSTVSATPVFEQLSLTLSLPLPFSRAHRGALDAADARSAQRDFVLDATRLRAAVEVRQAHARYASAVARLARYTGSLLGDADRVLAATLYQFERGGASLLEVLTAQRTVDEVTIGYEEALADHARTLIALERAAGLWDISL